MKRVWMLPVIAVLASGCASPQLVENQTHFDPKEAAVINERGANVIEGQAFLRQRGGGVVTCAGETVTLVPATSYAEERIRQIYGSANGGVRFWWDGLEFAETDPRYYRMVREEICDATGDFRFDDVADGDYYVTTGVSWEVPVNVYYSSTQGGTLARRVQVAYGQIERVILN